MVNLLLQCGDIDCNLQNLNKETALMWADENVEIVRALLQCKDIDCNIQDARGYTALGRARNNGQDEIARVLKAYESKIAMD